MMDKEDVAMVIDMMTAPPYMSQTEKIAGRISRKGALLLRHVIDLAITVRKNDKGTNLLTHLTEEVFEELLLLSEEFLEVTGQKETSERLSKLKVEK